MTLGAGVLITYVCMYDMYSVEALTREAQRKISHVLCVLTQLTLKKKFFGHCGAKVNELDKW